jgi:hypothetical protein
MTNKAARIPISEQALAKVESVIWQSGALARLAVLDFVLGQNDRNAPNVLLSEDYPIRVGLIDNDDSLVSHERLYGRFAYLDGLDGGLSLAVVRDWFKFSLPDLLAFLSPLALPETTTLALCRRFVFARWAIDLGLSLADFTHAIFVDRVLLDWQLPHVTWAASQVFVKEEEQGTLYRSLVGEQGGRCLSRVGPGREGPRSRGNPDPRCT